jgi:hypothetical protein
MFSTICRSQGRIAKQLIVRLAIIFYLTGCSQSGEGDALLLTGTPKTDAPEVTFMVDSTTVGMNDDVLLEWAGDNINDCIASGDWSGNKDVAGQQVIKALTANSTFTITCSGDSENVSETVGVTVSGVAVAPTVLISASPTSLAYGGSTTLSWSSTNASSCSASDGWTGGMNTSGSKTINALTSNTRFSLSCTGIGGTTIEGVNVSVGAPAPVIPPVVNLSASPQSIAYNGSHDLTWSTSNADSCVASGNWSGNKSVSGTRTRGNLTVDKTYTLTCTGPGGTSSDTVSVTVAAPPPTPTLSFSASPATVDQNGSTTLTWNSSDATDCAASGDWSGNLALSGSRLISGLTSDSQFSLTCTGPGGTSSDTVSVTVAAPPPTPTLSFSASPATVDQNGSTTLTWNSSDATDCAASGDWGGNLALSGSRLVSGLTSDSQFSLVCNGPGGTVNDTVNVAVVLNSTGTALMSWAPPTENEDNTTLTDLAGYRIYYGVSSGNYSDSIAIDNPGLSSYLIENLASATWYFSMTAVNSSGTESVNSLEVSKTIN